LDHLCEISLFPAKERRAGPEEQPDWLTAAQAGEPEALERFFHAYQAQVYTLCLRLLGRSEEAEDATQATFVQAFRALPRFQGRSNVRTWLYRIAMNEALLLLRRRRQAPVTLNEDCMMVDNALSLMERMVIQSTLARLKPDQRAILVLRFWEQLDYEEIAEVLAISLSAVKMRLSRARDAFRACYEEKP
jgi:RNA polymerase sigma-70 factor (ECF subfamily)